MIGLNTGSFELTIFISRYKFKNIRHLNTDELEAGLEEALTSPTDEGIVNLIVLSLIHLS